ncbi:hypothetical protein FRC18_004435 [Serendipita sp. 400]|nr:hypothetical protein FRC18_004435 [Serendipita sp. 400]
MTEIGSPSVHLTSWPIVKGESMYLFPCKLVFSIIVGVYIGFVEGIVRAGDIESREAIRVEKELIRWCPNYGARKLSLLSDFLTSTDTTAASTLHPLDQSILDRYYTRRSQMNSV